MKVQLITSLCLASFLGGVMLDHFASNRKAPVVVSPAIRHPDGSLTLGQLPADKKSLTPAEAKVPGKIVQVTRVTIHDTVTKRDTLRAFTRAGVDTAIVCPECPELHVSLVSSKQGRSLRVTALSDNGAIVSGQDLVLSSKLLAEHTHRLGLLAGVQRGGVVSYGAYIMKDVGLLTLSGSVMSDPKLEHAGFGIGLGFNF